MLYNFFTLREKLLDLYLAEYNSLRDEQLKRMDIQFSSVTWLFAVIAGVFTATTFLDEKLGIGDTERLSLLACVFLPMAAAPIAFMMLDHVIMVHRIGEYIRCTLQPQVATLLHANDYAFLCWDPQSTASKGTLYCMKFMFFPFGSWLIFFLAIPGATLTVTILGWWARWPYPPILALDWLLTLLFLYASVVAWNERAEWLHPTWRELANPFPFREAAEGLDRATSTRSD